MEYKFQGKRFEEFEIGEEYTTSARTITEADIVTFAGLSGDFNPLHTNEEFAKNTPIKGRIAHGMLTASIATGLANQSRIFEGTTIAVLSMTFRYTGIVRPGDTIKLVFSPKEKKESSKPGRGIITFDIKVINQMGEEVINGEWVVMMVKGCEKNLNNV